MSSNSDKQTDVSVVIPAYNEVESLPHLLDQVFEVLHDHYPESHEVWIIDDGSTDGSSRKMQTLVTRYSRLHYLRFRRNYGKAAALMEGFRRTSGRYVVTMDADLQDDPNEIPGLVQMLTEGADLVSGWKQNRQDPITKTIPSKLFNAVTRWFTGIQIHDFNCGLKAYRSEVTDSVSIQGEMHRYIPVLAHFMGFRVTEKPVRHHARQYGETKYGAGRFFKGFFDFITVLFLSRYTRRPMHFFGMVGFVMTLVGLIINVYLAIYWFQGGTLSDRPLLLLGVLLMMIGVQFFSIGLLGEMMVYGRGNEGPPAIREVLHSPEEQ